MIWVQCVLCGTPPSYTCSPAAAVQFERDTGMGIRGPEHCPGAGGEWSGSGATKRDSRDTTFRYFAPSIFIHKIYPQILFSLNEGGKRQQQNSTQAFERSPLETRVPGPLTWKPDVYFLIPALSDLLSLLVSILFIGIAGI